VFEGILQSFTIPEVRKRILFTLGVFAVYRLGAWIPVPGIDPDQVARFFNDQTGAAAGIFGFINLFTGNAFRNFSLFALGVIPYINASIIMSLLQNVVPYLKELNKEGDEGRKILQKYIRYGTVGLAFFQAAGVGIFISSNQGLLLPDVSPILFYLTTIICLTAGTMFLMWLGERITENGIGRGVSMIIMAGIIASYPNAFGQAYVNIQGDTSKAIWLLIIPIMFLVVVAGVVMIQLGARRVEIQYAKRIVRGKVYGGQNTYIPFAVNQGGVIPIIFAAAILTFFQIPIQLLSKGVMANSDFLQLLNLDMSRGGVIYLVLYSLMIIFFTYFYSTIVFNPQDLADNLRRWGGYIPGIRPGKPTSDYLERIQSRLLTIGGVFLVLIALLPYVVQGLSGLQAFYALGGTSVLIAVGVGVDTMKQIEAHMVERHYESLIRKGGPALGR
jgi:preprotein translocase subunit SecY